MTNLVKPFKTFDEQIALLRDERGMTVDSELATQWLGSVNYYRISGYSYVYRSADSDKFLAGTTFAEVVRLYEFDRKLRMLLHDAVERLEIAVRSRISHHLGSIDPLAHQDKDKFRPTFKHADWHSLVQKRIARAKAHSRFVQHHFENREGQIPIWALVEILDFADVSKLYAGMLSEDQRIVARHLGFEYKRTQLSKRAKKAAGTNHPLAGWLHNLSVLRNVVAHHGRVWNRKFVPVATAPAQTIPGLESLPDGQNEQLYGLLCVAAHLLRTVSPGMPWASHVRNLIEDEFESLPRRSVAEMGFPASWKSQTLWQN